MSKSL